MHSRAKSPIVRNRRRDIRRAAPELRVIMDGNIHRVADWSLGGLLILDHDGTIEPGAERDVTVAYQHKGKSFAVEARVSVVRSEPERRCLACRFVEYKGDAWERLENLSINRI